jgi:hypothetical protein
VGMVREVDCRHERPSASNAVFDAAKRSRVSTSQVHGFFVVVSINLDLVC